MINTFKKLWKFAEREQGMIRSSVIWSFLGAIFNVFQFMAIYLVIAAIIKQEITWQTIGMCSAFLLLSLLGIIISKKNSMLKQTHAGYFTAANKRIAMGEKIKKVPMGFFNDFSLGNLTAIATTKLDSLETWVPTLFIMVFGGLLVTVVFILSLFMLHWKIALIAIAGSLIFLAAAALMQQRSKKSSDRVSVVQNDLTKEVLATLQGMQIIKSYNLGGQNNNKLDQSFEETKKSTLSLEKAVTPYTVLLKIIIAITISVMIATAQLRLKKWCKAISLLPSNLHYATSLQTLKSLSITCKRWSMVSCVHDSLFGGSSKRRECLSMKCVATNHSSF